MVRPACGGRVWATPSIFGRLPDVKRRCIMLYRLALLGAVAAVWIALPAFAEEAKVIDARIDKSADGMYLTFISKRVKAGSPMGDAFMTVGKGKSPDAIEVEASYGMYLDNRKPKSGTVPTEIVDALRTSSEGEPTQTFIAKIDKEQYDKAIQKIGSWTDGKELTSPNPPGVALEATSAMLTAIKSLKKPYIAGFGTPDAQTYYADLRLLNRNK